MQAPKFSRRSFLKSGAVAAAAASLPGFSLPAAAAAAPIGTVCQTQHGPVQGIRQEGHLVWYGIPYGASTAGDARWTAPQDPAPWGRRQRLHRPRRGGVPVQHLRPGHRRLPQIRRLHHGKGQQTAVIVYLHSGGNQIGSARELPGGFLAEQLGCVFVGLEYRLGLFGFNCLPAFCSGPEETGNFARWTWPRRWTGCGTISHRSAATAEHHGPRLCSRRAGRNGPAGQSPVCGPVPESHLYFRRHDLRG